MNCHKWKWINDTEELITKLNTINNLKYSLNKKKFIDGKMSTSPQSYCVNSQLQKQISPTNTAFTMHPSVRITSAKAHQSSGNVVDNQDVTSLLHSTQASDVGVTKACDNTNNIHRRRPFSGHPLSRFNSERSKAKVNFALSPYTMQMTICQRPLSAQRPNQNQNNLGLKCKTRPHSAQQSGTAYVSPIRFTQPQSAWIDSEDNISKEDIKEALKPKFHLQIPTVYLNYQDESDDEFSTERLLEHHSPQRNTSVCIDPAPKSFIFSEDLTNCSLIHSAESCSIAKDVNSILSDIDESCINFKIEASLPLNSVNNSGIYDVASDINCKINTNTNLDYAENESNFDNIKIVNDNDVYDNHCTFTELSKPCKCSGKDEMFSKDRKSITSQDYLFNQRHGGQVWPSHHRSTRILSQNLESVDKLEKNKKEICCKNYLKPCGVYFVNENNSINIVPQKRDSRFMDKTEDLEMHHEQCGKRWINKNRGKNDNSKLTKEPLKLFTKSVFRPNSKITLVKSNVSNGVKFENSRISANESAPQSPVTVKLNMSSKCRKSILISSDANQEINSYNNPIYEADKLRHKNKLFSKASADVGTFCQTTKVLPLTLPHSNDLQITDTTDKSENTLTKNYRIPQKSPVSPSKKYVNMSRMEPDNCRVTKQVSDAKHSDIHSSASSDVGCVMNKVSGSSECRLTKYLPSTTDENELSPRTQECENLRKRLFEKGLNFNLDTLKHALLPPSGHMANRVCHGDLPKSSSSTLLSHPKTWLQKEYKLIQKYNSLLRSDRKMSRGKNKKHRPKTSTNPMKRKKIKPLSS